MSQIRHVNLSPLPIKILLKKGRKGRCVNKNKLIIEKRIVEVRVERSRHLGEVSLYFCKSERGWEITKRGNKLDPWNPEVHSEIYPCKNLRTYH